MSENQKLLFLGALGLVGSFFVSTAAIEGFAHARLQAKMHGPKQQKPKPKSSTMDDIVKFGGVALSLYTMLQQAPEMIEKASSLLGE